MSNTPESRIDELRLWLKDNPALAADDARSVTISIGALKELLSSESRRTCEHGDDYNGCPRCNTIFITSSTDKPLPETNWKARAEYYLAQLEEQRAAYIALSATHASDALNALRGLSKAVKQLADHFDKPITDDNVTLWLALNSAQAHAEKVLACTPSAETCSERSLRDLMDDVRRLGSNFNNAEILLAWKASHPDFHIISSDRSPDV